MGAGYGVSRIGSLVALGLGGAKQLTRPSDFLGARAVGEEAVVAVRWEPGRQDQGG